MFELGKKLFFGRWSELSTKTKVAITLTTIILSALMYDTLASSQSGWTAFLNYILGAFVGITLLMVVYEDGFDLLVYKVLATAISPIVLNHSGFPLLQEYRYLPFGIIAAAWFFYIFFIEPDHYRDHPSCWDD